MPLAQMGRLIFYTHMYVEMPARYKEWMDERLTEFDYDQQVKFLTGSLVPGELYVKVQKLRAMLRRQVHAALGRFDVLASPTMRVTAPLIKPNAMPSSKQDAADLLVRGAGPDAAGSSLERAGDECAVRVFGAGNGRDADWYAADRASVPGGCDSGDGPRIRAGDAVAPAAAGDLGDIFNG